MSPDRAAIAPAHHVEIDRRLWTVVLAGPTAWALAAGAGYVIASRACAHGRPAVAAAGVSILAAVALLVALAAAIASYRRWHSAREHRRFVSGARADDVGSFLAWAGTVTAGLSVFGSLMVFIGPFLVSPCVHGW